MPPRHSVEGPHTVLAPAITEEGLIKFARTMSTLLITGDCITLRGTLGMGKTTFARALVRALLDDPSHDVPSPTFALRQDYVSLLGHVVHFDFYRISDQRELDELGFAEALERAITIIEWPERAEADLPANRFELVLEVAPRPETRRLTLRGYGKTAARARSLGAVLPTLL